MKCAKIRYRDELGAKIALASTALKGRGKNDEKRREMRAYRCPICNGWHLTSESRRRAPRKGARL